MFTEEIRNGGEQKMSRLSFLYDMDLSHRAVSVYIYILPTEPIKITSAFRQSRLLQEN